MRMLNTKLKVGQLAFVHKHPKDSALGLNPAGILYKSIAGRYRSVSYPDGPITARYRFIKNTYWEYNTKHPDLKVSGYTW